MPESYVIKTKSGLFEIEVASYWVGQGKWSIILDGINHPIVDVWTGDVDPRNLKDKLTKGAQVVFEKTPGKPIDIQAKHPSSWANAGITDPILSIHHRIH